jgi:hypothetical protein
LDRSGRRKAVAEIARIYNPEAFRSRAIAPEKEPLHFALQFQNRRIQSFAARIDDDGTLWIQLIELAANGLAEPPFDPIADHSFADGTRNREPNPWAVSLSFTDIEGGEQRSGKAGAFIVNPSEILRAQ